jgi:hypothetical protein
MKDALEEDRRFFKEVEMFPNMRSEANELLVKHAEGGSSNYRHVSAVGNFLTSTGLWG